MRPEDRLGLMLALYEAGTLSPAEAAHAVLTVVGGEGAGPPASLPAPLAGEMRSLLRGPRGQELAKRIPPRYESLAACCGLPSSQ